MTKAGSPVSDETKEPGPLVRAASQPTSRCNRAQQTPVIGHDQEERRGGVVGHVAFLPLAHDVRWPAHRDLLAGDQPIE